MSDRWLCKQCKVPEECIGHCPLCNSNQIGGGGANGMFCVDCDWDGDSTGPYEESADKKVFLDDERQPPAGEGWIRVEWPDDAIALLITETVTHLSLDHDLGDDTRGTGYDVLLWLEEAVHGGFTPPEYIVIHSANASAWTKMSQAIDSIRKLSDGHRAKKAAEGDQQ